MAEPARKIYSSTLPQPLVCALERRHAIVLDPDDLDEAIIDVVLHGDREAHAVYDMGKIHEVFAALGDEAIDEEQRWIEAIEFTDFNTVREVDYLARMEPDKNPILVERPPVKLEEGEAGEEDEDERQVWTSSKGQGWIVVAGGSVLD